jgi:hypothetical protein
MLNGVASISSEIIPCVCPWAIWTNRTFVISSGFDARPQRLIAVRKIFLVLFIFQKSTLPPRYQNINTQEGTVEKGFALHHKNRVWSRSNTNGKIQQLNTVVMNIMSASSNKYDQKIEPKNGTGRCKWAVTALQSVTEKGHTLALYNELSL